MDLPSRGVRPSFGGCSLSCVPHSFPTCGCHVLALWKRPCRYHRCGRLVTSVSPSTLLEAPSSKSGSWSRQNLARRSLPVELFMPMLTQFLRLCHNQGSVAPLDDVSLENGRSLRFRLRVGAPVSNIWNTLVPSNLFVLARFPSAVMSASCCSHPHRMSSESSCVQFLTISDPAASSLVANLNCDRLHVWRQLLTCTQIVSFLTRTRSPLSAQPAGPHQPWAPASSIDIHWISPRLRSGKRCRLAPVRLSSLARVRSPRWYLWSSSFSGSGAFVQDPCTPCHEVPTSPPTRPSQHM